jgi:excisionase family DNA binding protein
MHETQTQFVSLATAAERAAVSARTIRRAISCGELCAYKVMGQLRLKSGDVDVWLNSRPLVTVKR